MKSPRPSLTPPVKTTNWSRLFHTSVTIVESLENRAAYRKATKDRNSNCIEESARDGCVYSLSSSSSSGGVRGDSASCCSRPPLEAPLVLLLRGPLRVRPASLSRALFATCNTAQRSWQFTICANENSQRKVCCFHTLSTSSQRRVAWLVPSRSASCGAARWRRRSRCRRRRRQRSRRPRPRRRDSRGSTCRPRSPLPASLQHVSEK